MSNLYRIDTDEIRRYDRQLWIDTLISTGVLVPGTIDYEAAADKLAGVGHIPSSGRGFVRDATAIVDAALGDNE